MGYEEAAIIPIKRFWSIFTKEGGHPLNLVIFIVGALIGLIFMVIIGAMWGLLTLIGVVLLFAGILVIIANRGKHGEPLFVVCIIAGIVLIIINQFAMEIVPQIDLSQVQILKDIHNFFKP